MKTKAQEITTRVIVKDTIKRKERIFEKVEQNLEQSLSQLKWIFYILESYSKNMRKYTLFLRDNSAKKAKVKMYT